MGTWLGSFIPIRSPLGKAYTYLRFAPRATTSFAKQACIEHLDAGPGTQRMTWLVASSTTCILVVIDNAGAVPLAYGNVSGLHAPPRLADYARGALRKSASNSLQLAILFCSTVSRFHESMQPFSAGGSVSARNSFLLQQSQLAATFCVQQSSARIRFSGMKFSVYDSSLLLHHYSARSSASLAGVPYVKHCSFCCGLSDR